MDMGYPLNLAKHFLGVGGVIIREGQVLLVKLKYGGARNYWLIPGGLVEPGETLEEGLIREIKEETNLEVQPTGILGIRSMVRKDDGLTDVYTVFSAEVTGNLENLKKQESEISELAWIDLAALDDRDDVLGYTRTIVNVAIKSPPMERDHQFDQQARERIGLTSYEQFWVNHTT